MTLLALRSVLSSVWFWLALALAGAGLMGKLWMHEREAFAGYRSAVDALNQAAQDRAAARIAAERSKKEVSDAQYAAASVAWVSALDRLRRSAGPVGPIMPAAAAGASHPERACFDRAILEPGLRSLLEDFRGRARGIVEKGDGFRLRLDNAIDWGASIRSE